MATATRALARALAGARARAFALARARAIALARATAVATTLARRAFDLAAAAATAATTALAQTSNGLTLATDQRDADHREEDRDSKSNKTIHSNILHLLTGTVSEKRTHSPAVQ